MKKRTDEPWMEPPDFGRSLSAGLGVNLLVSSVAASVEFATRVLQAELTYADTDFAVLRAQGSTWLLHADHTYSDHPLVGFVAGLDGRGAGVELRLYGLDPDRAEATARERGCTILAGAMDKPHGLREAYILDPDGYVWVPSVASAD